MKKNEVEEIAVRSIMDIPFLANSKNHHLIFTFDCYDHGDRIRCFSRHVNGDEIILELITDQSIILSNDELYELITDNIFYLSLKIIPKGKLYFSQNWVYRNNEGSLKLNS